MTFAGSQLGAGTFKSSGRRIAASLLALNTTFACPKAAEWRIFLPAMADAGVAINGSLRRPLC